jgi:hypothetical protein
MARPKKIGLDYFPLDVDFDDKVNAIELLHGNNGLAWVIKFWQSAYKTETGEVILQGLFGELFSNKCRITTEEHQKILNTALSIGFIYESEEGAYTSNGIKKRILAVYGDRASAQKRKPESDDKDKKDIKNKHKLKETPHCSANNTRTIPEQLEKRPITPFRLFAQAYPHNGTCVDPNAEKKFDKAIESGVPEGLIIQAAADYAEYYKKKLGPKYPNSQYIANADNWIISGQYMKNWKAMMDELTLEEVKQKPVNTGWTLPKNYSVVEK